MRVYLLILKLKSRSWNQSRTSESNENFIHIEIDAKANDIRQNIFYQECYIKEDPLKIAVNDSKKRKFSCDHCDYVAKQKSVLLEHKASHHDRIRHPCDQCVYAATSKTNKQQQI